MMLKEYNMLFLQVIVGKKRNKEAYFNDWQFLQSLRKCPISIRSGGGNYWP